MIDKDELWRARNLSLQGAYGYSAPQYAPPMYQSPPRNPMYNPVYEPPQRSVQEPDSQRSLKNNVPPFARVTSREAISDGNSQTGRPTDMRSNGSNIGHLKGLSDQLERERVFSRHQVSQSLVKSSPFSINSPATRAELDRQLQYQKQMEFMTSINQQIEERKSVQKQYQNTKEREAEQRLKDLQLLRIKEQNEKDRKRSLSNSYRQVLDLQSGAADRQQFELSTKRFFGVEDSISKSKNASVEFHESACRFYGVDVPVSSQDVSSTQLSPLRLAKTMPKTVMSDPITGSVRSIPASRQNTSLGNYKPVYVSGKINDSPPPRNVFLEQPNFGKKIPRKVLFNPLTGERRVLGESEERPVRSRNSVENPFKQYENSMYYRRFQEDFIR